MRFARLLLLGVLAVCLQPFQLPAAPIRSEAIYTNRSRFRIPFRFDQAEMQRIGAQAIQLFVSDDRGTRWKLVQSVGTQASHFEFEAPSDSEYWFAVRTLDAQNRLNPPGDIVDAGLKVIVDRSEPLLEVDLTQPAPGRVKLTWNAADVYLDVSTLQLDLIQTGTAQWQPVQVSSGPSGSTSWSVPEGGLVAVRAEVRDFAGNRSQLQRQIRIADVGETVPQPKTPVFGEPVAEAPTPTFRPQRTAEAESAAPSDRRSAVEPFQTSSTSAAPTMMLPGPSMRHHASDRLPVINSSAGGLTTIRAKSAKEERSVNDAPQVAPSQAAVSGKELPIVTDRESKPGGLASERLVNTTRFDIQYAVEEVGSSGVGGVELYVTEDNGRKWWLYGEDADARSPMIVDVPGEGRYGFCLRIRSGAGLAIDPPAPGDLPELTVVVDQTPPRVEFLPLDARGAEHAGEVVVRWRLFDDNPTEARVSLAYAEQPNGPWRVVADGLPSTGSYAWNVAVGVPPRVYLRVVAEDAAGNAGEAITPTRVLVDVARPSGRILDVEANYPRGGLRPR